MNAIFKIEKNVPLPNVGKGRPSEFTFAVRQMDVGDSLLVPFDSTRTHKQQNGNIANNLGSISKRTGRKFTTRRKDDGFRIWRTL